MSMPVVLVIGSPKNVRLSDVMFEAGVTPVFRGTILAAMAAFRKERFLAAVVDPESANVDVLEAVLNIRDVDGELRIFVLSRRATSLAGDRSPGQASIVTMAELTRELALLVAPGTGNGNALAAASGNRTETGE